MVQGDGRLHKEDVERWYREMVNYIKKLCGDEMVQGNGKLHKKRYGEMVQGRAMVNYIKKMGRDGVERW